MEDSLSPSPSLSVVSRVVCVVDSGTGFAKDVLYIFYITRDLCELAQQARFNEIFMWYGSSTSFAQLSVNLLTLKTTTYTVIHGSLVKGLLDGSDSFFVLFLIF